MYYRIQPRLTLVDRWGTYTKEQKVIPVGDTVAVQNQTGRFPKKWDKTGNIVENVDYDKALIKYDGSGRLTTRNRRFVKKIVSPPDLQHTAVPQAQSVVPACDIDDAILEEGGHALPGPLLDGEVIEDHVTDNQTLHAVGEGVLDKNDDKSSGVMD